MSETSTPPGTVKETRTVFVVAGEASGDGHAASLVEHLREKHPEWRFAGLGGDNMAAAGVELRTNLVDRSVMGFRKVVAEMGYIVGVTSRVLEELRRSPPDLLILVDYPGLNLNLARMARRLGIPVVYYICPQVWAWAPWRIRRIAKRADLLLVILPFEERLYGAAHANVQYVGNPVFDRLSRWEAEHDLETTRASLAVSPADRILALFPGSRRQEVEEALPLMLRSIRRLTRDQPELKVVISCHRPKLRTIVDEALAAEEGSFVVHEGDPHALQRSSHLSLVVSGTATLEQAFFGVPLVVVYPVRPWQRWVFSFLSVTPFIALVNLFAGKAVVPEFLVAPGEECGDGSRLEAAVCGLSEGPERERTLDQLASLRSEVFVPGASRRAADRICRFLEENGPTRQPA